MFEISPVSHLIASGLLVWLALELRRSAGGAETRSARVALVGALALWVLLSSWIAWEGSYLARNESHLLLLWGIAAPYALVGTLALASAEVRALLVRFARNVPLSSVTAVHAVRVLALGTILKWWSGLLPGHFILPVGVPDFAIGATALVMARRASRDFVGSRRALAIWNLAGAALLLLAVPLIQLSQPGPLQLYASGPRTDEVLGFPMSIVPTFVAPFFIGLHGIALYRIYATKNEPSKKRRSDMKNEKPIHVTPESFQKEVLESDRPVLVDFWADWCGPCHRIAPAIDALASDFEGRATVAKLDVDDAPELAERYGIRSIPAVLFFRGGEVVHQSAGVVPKQALADALEDVIQAA